MSNIYIREYSPADLDGLRFLAGDIQSEEEALLVSGSLSLLECDGAISFVALSDGLPVGFNVGFILPSGVLLPEGMYVDPDYRKRGIAKMLSEALENASGCSVSIAYYKKELAPYYDRLGYNTGNVVVGIKEIKL